MTGAESSEVDFDLLADYVGGALDGTPDEAVVSALIVGHPTWRRAHAELSGATEAMTAALRSWGTEPEPMPVGLVARLDAVFAPATAELLERPAAESGAAVEAGAAATGGSAVDAGATTVISEAGGAGFGAGRMEPGSDGAAPVRHLVAVPDKDERPTTARKRARRLKWAAPIGIAAGLVAFLGFGVPQFGGRDAQETSSSAGSAADQQTAGVLALPAGPGQVLASGTDYTAGTLAQAAARPMIAAEPVPPQASAPARAGDSESDEAGKQRAATDVPSAGAMAGRGDPLQRLRVQEALLACIDAISDAHGAGAVTARSIDYARFDGAPALIVQFTAGNGEWVWAAGADCGRPGSGADRLGAVRVG